MTGILRPETTPPTTKPRKRVGIIELLTDTRASGWVQRAYAHVLTKQFASITPQAVAIWCRQLGHQVHYTTYYGQADPYGLLPHDLDVLFVSAPRAPAAWRTRWPHSSAGRAR